MSAEPPSEPASAPAKDLPAPAVARRRNWLPSLIWFIPVVAALVGLSLIFKLVIDRGPQIVINFQTAEGLEAGKTAVKYKDVQIGTVTAVTLARNRLGVQVKVQLSKEADSFTAADTRFWVVRPRMDTSGISGLSTLLSGAYIGADAGHDSEKTAEFTGLELPPIVTRDASGKQYILHARDIGSLDIGSPVFFRRIKVGQVAAYELDGDGRGVTLRVFINKPYDRFVGANTRFWHASGVEIQADASGFKLRTQSLATVVLGGIAFQSPDEVIGPPAPEDAAFVLALDENTAMRDPDGPAKSMVLYFNQSLRGLVPGAAVDFRGVVVGEVKSIGVEFDRAEREFRMPVLVEIYPDRLRRRETHEQPSDMRWTPEQRLRFLIGKGLRAQLRTGNLLTGQLYIALDLFPKAPAIQLDTSRDPLELPTVSSNLDEIQSQVAEIATKLNKVPFEQIGSDARAALATLNKTLLSAEKLSQRLNNDVSPEITAAMKDVRSTLQTAERTLSNDSPLQQDMRQTLQELTRAAASLRTLTDYLEKHPESLIRGKAQDDKP